MRFLLAAAFFAASTLFFPTPVQAQSPEQIVIGWYQRFLDRVPDDAGLRSWAGGLRRGDSPSDLLAQILASDEYYKRAGSTPEGFVAKLFADIAGRKADPKEFAELVNVTLREGRTQAARRLLDRFPQPAVVSPPFPRPRDLRDRGEKRER
jgi:hypothetical protein